MIPTEMLNFGFLLIGPGPGSGPGPRLVLVPQRQDVFRLLFGCDA